MAGPETTNVEWPTRVCIKLLTPGTTASIDRIEMLRCMSLLLALKGRPDSDQVCPLLKVDRPCHRAGGVHPKGRKPYRNCAMCSNCSSAHAPRPKLAEGGPCLPVDCIALRVQSIRVSPPREALLHIKKVGRAGHLRGGTVNPTVAACD